MRGGAIVLVFFCHAVTTSFHPYQAPWAGWQRAGGMSFSSLVLVPAEMGWSGVAIFFVVSGFCIHWSHARSGEKGFRIFFVRRFFRIYPPYALALLIFALGFPETRLHLSSRHDVDQLIGHLLLLQNMAGPSFLYGVNASFWSIATEAQLYLIYPVLLQLVRRQGWPRTLWLIGGVEVLLRGLLGWLPWQSPASYWLLGNPLLYWFSWSIGAKVADDFLQGRALSLGRASPWLWAGLAVGTNFIRPLVGFGFLLAALATAAFLARRLAAISGVAGARRTWLEWVGVISYSVYLLHQPLLLAAGPGLARVCFGGGAGSWEVLAGCLGCLPVILGISWGFYRWVERPSVRLGKWVMGWLLGQSGWRGAGVVIELARGGEGHGG